MKLAIADFAMMINIKKLYWCFIAFIVILQCKRRGSHWDETAESEKPN